MHLLLFNIVIISKMYVINGAKMEAIIDGSFTDIKKYPHAVLLVDLSFFGSGLCGASILNQKILLTAAHCLPGCCEDKTKKSLQIFAGHHNISESAIQRYVDDWRVHEEFNERLLFNDIGLFIIKGSLPFWRNTKRIIIPKKLPTLVNREALVAGWGKTENINEPLGRRLKEAKIRLSSKRQCLKFDPKFTSSKLCTFYSASYPSHDFKGDSGSALVTLDRRTQVGIVSHGHSVGQGNENIQGVYTNVPKYWKWISRNSKRLYCAQKRHHKFG